MIASPRAEFSPCHLNLTAMDSGVSGVTGELSIHGEVTISASP